jgi:hypothetical protein
MVKNQKTCVNSARSAPSFPKLLLTAVVFGLTLSFSAYAKGPAIPLDEQITANSLKAIALSSVIIAVVTVISLAKSFMSDRYRKFAFYAMIIPTSLTTIYMAGSTIYLNHISSSRGPVHWHADFLIFNCGEAIDLKEPRGLSNRIGTPVLHEHGDNRIHVEGVVINPDDVSLKNFFSVVGGIISEDLIVFPTDDGPLLVKNGDKCPDGREGQWQVFAYKTNPDTNIVRQEKLADFPDYILSPYGVVPPADCIIFEFTPDTKEKTDKICNFYEIELNKGNIKFQ